MQRKGRRFPYCRKFCCSNYSRMRFFNKSKRIIVLSNNRKANPGGSGSYVSVRYVNDLLLVDRNWQPTKGSPSSTHGCSRVELSRVLWVIHKMRLVTLVVETEPPWWTVCRQTSIALIMHTSKYTF